MAARASVKIPTSFGGSVGAATGRVWAGWAEAGGLRTAALLGEPADLRRKAPKQPRRRHISDGLDSPTPTLSDGLAL
eukprot:gene10635-16423_t